MSTKTIYEICKTNIKNHLNGTITIFNIDDTNGVAIVNVKEDRYGSDDPVKHFSSELITYENEVWRTIEPHDSISAGKQHWYFKMINNIDEGPGNIYNDTSTYSSYIKYHFLAPDRIPFPEDEPILEGDGTGTGGNGQS
jgi:hypothetical protein